MLDLGFLPDVETLLARRPASRQTMLFSATMPGAVVAMARRYMTQPTHIRAADPDDDGQTVKNIKQLVYRAHAMDKVEMLARILQAEGRGLAMVFAAPSAPPPRSPTSWPSAASRPARVHGDLGQGAREQALRAFRNGKVDVLVATDVAARGIDVEGVTHVINYQSPEDEKTYLHRIGRTGRAGAKGIAVTFVDWDDIPRWGLINKALDLGFPEPRRDVLHLAAPVRGPRHPRGHQGPPAASRSADPRGPGGRGARGPGRDRQARRFAELGLARRRPFRRTRGSYGGRSGSRDAGRSGGRGDGDRSAGRSSATAGEARAPRAEAPAAPAAGAEGGSAEGAASRPRRQRNRRRTHGGASGAPAAELILGPTA